MNGVKRGVTIHGLTEDSSTERQPWRNLDFGKGNPFYFGQYLDK